MCDAISNAERFLAPFIKRYTKESKARVSLNSHALRLSAPEPWPKITRRAHHRLRQERLAGGPTSVSSKSLEVPEVPRQAQRTIPARPKRMPGGPLFHATYPRHAANSVSLFPRAAGRIRLVQKHCRREAQPQRSKNTGLARAICRPSSSFSLRR